MEQKSNGTLMEKYLILGRHLVRRAAWEHRHEPEEHLRGRIRSLLGMKAMGAKELSGLLNTPLPAVERELNALETRGWAERESDRWRLTPEGTAQPDADAQETDPFACLTEEEQDILSQYLDRLLEAQETGRSEPEGFWFGRSLWGLPHEHRHGRGPGHEFGMGPHPHWGDRP